MKANKTHKETIMKYQRLEEIFMGILGILTFVVVFGL